MSWRGWLRDRVLGFLFDDESAAPRRSASVDRVEEAPPGPLLGPEAQQMLAARPPPAPVVSPVVDLPLEGSLAERRARLRRR